jgi:hypothetical protein
MCEDLTCRISTGEHSADIPACFPSWSYGSIPVAAQPPPAGLATARSLPPRCHNPSRDAFLTRHQQGFTGVRPSRPFPSPVAPGRNGDPRALPWAPHPAEQDPAAHARAVTSLRHWPGITPSPSATPLSGPTHHERPHVANHLSSAPRVGPDKHFDTPIVREFSGLGGPGVLIEFLAQFLG